MPDMQNKLIVIFILIGILFGSQKSFGLLNTDQPFFFKSGSNKYK